MQTLVTKKIKLFNAQQILESVSETANTKLYMFIGRPQEWPVETLPNDAYDTDEQEYRCWDEMLAMKQIYPSQVKIVIPRIDWLSGTVYTAYDDKANLTDTNFYVITSNFSVYKCISNNEGGPSTVEPSEQKTEIIFLSDGYRWKYMYSLTAADQLGFLTAQWMPVNIDETIKAAAVDGQLDTILPVTLGSNYTTANTTVTIKGTGSNAIVNPIILNNKITGYDIIDGGSGYKYADVVIESLDGEGAEARAIIPPNKGHGENPVFELDGYYIMFNTRFQFNEGVNDFPTDVRYRTIGLVRDPKNFNNEVINLPTANTNYVLKVQYTAGSVFEKNDFITGNISLANAFVIASNVTSATNVDVRYMQSHNFTENYKKFIVGELITSSTTGATGVVKQIYNPEVKPYTGDVLYVSNRTSIKRSSDQTENVHLVIEF